MGLKTKKIPLRQCLGCNEMKSKKEMLRIIKTPEGAIDVDYTGKKNGRGAYLCNSVDCFNKARKTKALERSLKTSIPQEVYEELERELRSVESK